MRRDLGVFILVACPAFAQSAPAKLVTLDIAAVGAHGQAIPDLRSSEIEIFDNKKAQSIVYWRSNQRRPDIPHVTVVLFSLEKAGIKSVAWKETIGAMRRTAESCYPFMRFQNPMPIRLPGTRPGWTIAYRNSSRPTTFYRHRGIWITPRVVALRSLTRNMPR